MNDIFLRPLEADKEFLEILHTIAADRHLELSFIDLLSQLEFVGCRKMIKAVPFSEINLEVLRHIAEEASHAYLLKSLVGPAVTWNGGRFAAAGWKYFQRLDHSISALADNPNLHYPGVSWAIERRALAVYPYYLEISRNEGLVRALKQILAQEKRHRDHFNQIDFPGWYREKMIQIESDLWNELKCDLRAAIAN